MYCTKQPIRTTDAVNQKLHATGLPPSYDLQRRSNRVLHKAQVFCRVFLLPSDCPGTGCPVGVAAHALKALRSGDTLVVWRLDRLGRSLPDLLAIVGDLERRQVSFESLTEKLETSSATGRLVFHVFGALEDFERNLIRERTAAGLASARARGRKGGRPEAIDAAKLAEIRALYDARTISPTTIAKRYGISRTTLYRYLAKPAGGLS